MNILDALRQGCEDEIKRYGIGTRLEVEQVLGGTDVRASRYGALTGRVALQLGKSSASVRRQLHKLEKEGKVMSRPTRGGCTRWWPVGFAAELAGKYLNGAQA